MYICVCFLGLSRTETSVIYLRDFILVGGMAPPGGGRNTVSPRFLRHFNVIGMLTFDDTIMKNIFAPILDWHFSLFEAVQRRFSRVGFMQFLFIFFISDDMNCRFLCVLMFTHSAN